jgi:hypothetical protein
VPTMQQALTVAMGAVFALTTEPVQSPLPWD